MALGTYYLLVKCSLVTNGSNWLASYILLVISICHVA
jgi:hypothetical protein